MSEGPRRENIVMARYHDLVHQGKIWQVGYSTPDGAPLADDGNWDMLVRVPIGKAVHMVHRHWCEGLAQSYIYEAPTYSAGTSLVPTNHNRYEDDAESGVTVLGAPTVTAVGLALVDGLWMDWAIPIDFSAELVLKGGVDYLYRLTARAATLRSSIDLAWYVE